MFVYVCLQVGSGAAAGAGLCGAVESEGVEGVSSQQQAGYPFAVTILDYSQRFNSM